MPELPEMKTYRRNLEQTVTGLQIVQAEVLREKSINVPVASFAERTQNQTITGGIGNCYSDRGGEPCPRCGRAIIQTSLSGRKVFYCEHCQT